MIKNYIKAAGAAALLCVLSGLMLATGIIWVFLKLAGDAYYIDETQKTNNRKKYS